MHKPIAKRIGHTIQTFRISYSARKKLFQIIEKLKSQGVEDVSMTKLIQIAMRYTWGVDIFEDISEDQ